ncbi:MAG TPA: DsbC family protein [Azoarcus sp.]|nr:DsbC family protein [Azoarcus sp.]
MSARFVQPWLLASALVATSSFADEAAVKKAMEEFIGGPGVEMVTKTPYGELYEVLLRGGDIVYTDEAVSFLVDGRIIDTESRSDVTQARKNELSSIDFSMLPLDQAIKRVQGDGERIIVSFEDPNCIYCKRLAQDLATMDNVTLYTFLYPVLGESSENRARNIWCAEDSATVWEEWMLDGREPPEVSCDSSVIEANLAVGKQLRVVGTPTMFLANGRRIGGYKSADQLEQDLAEVQ